MNSNQSKLIQDAFRSYLDLDLDPLPIPNIKGYPTKKPIILDWQTTADAKGFTESDFNEPCNIGVELGGSKNLTDVDCDSLLSVKAAGYLYSEDTDPFMIFGRSSKPDSHYVFFTDESLPSFKINHPITGVCVVEFRCAKQDGTRGMQTVFPPSIWCDKNDPTHQEQIETTHQNPACAPVKASTLANEVKAIAAMALLAESFPIKGKRHDTILALAGWFARGGMREDKAKLLIGGAYGISEGFNHDLSKAQSDVVDVFKSHTKDPNAHLYGFTKLKDIGYPVKVLECVADLLKLKKQDSAGTATDTQRYTLTDTGLGLRFVDSFGDDFKFVIESKEWMTWDGSVWVADNSQVRREKAKQIGKMIRDEANNIKVSDDDEDNSNEIIKKALVRHANYAESTNGIDAMLKSASSDRRLVVSIAEFDVHPELLNVKNGVVDLRSGILQTHDRALLMTQKAPTDYTLFAVSSEFNTALDTWTKNHPDLKDYMQRLYGYSITGIKHEEKIVIMKGIGGSGKGTYNALLHGTLGSDYVRNVEAKTLLESKRSAGSASSDVIRLEGARIVVCSEIDKASRMAQGLMKTLSGNDVITARPLYQAEREFKCNAQIFIQTNFRPVIDSTDTGNRRRYVELPFDNQMIPDKQLKDRLLRSVEVREAMLSWLVQGAVDYYQHGLGSCKAVDEATTDFFDSNDELGGFLKECLVREDGGKITRDKLYEIYIQYCREEGCSFAQKTRLYGDLRERGYSDLKWRDGADTLRGFKGIREKTDADLFTNAPFASALEPTPEVKEPQDMQTADYKANSSLEWIGDTAEYEPKRGVYKSNTTEEQPMKQNQGHKRKSLKSDVYRYTQEEIDAEFGPDSGRLAWDPDDTPNVIGWTWANRLKHPSVFNGGIPRAC